MGNAVAVEADGIAFRRKLPLLGKAPLAHRISFPILSPHPPVPGAESGSVVVEIGIKEISAAYAVHGMGSAFRIFRIGRKNFDFIGGSSGIPI